MLPVNSTQQSSSMPYKGECRITQLHFDVIFLILHQPQLTSKDLLQFLCCRRFLQLENHSSYVHLIFRRTFESIPRTLKILPNEYTIHAHRIFSLGNSLCAEASYYDYSHLRYGPVAPSYGIFQLNKCRSALIEYAINFFQLDDHFITVDQAEATLFNHSFLAQDSHPVDFFKSEVAVEYALHDKKTNFSAFYLKAYEKPDHRELILCDGSFRTKRKWSTNHKSCFYLNWVNDEMLSIIGIFEKTYQLNEIKKFSCISDEVITREFNLTGQSLFSNNGQYLAIASNNSINLVRTKDLQTAKVLQSPFNINFNHLVMSQTHVLVSLSEWHCKVLAPNHTFSWSLGKILILDLRDPELHWKEVLSRSRKVFRPVALTKNYFVICDGYQAEIWDLHTLQRIIQLPKEQSYIHHICFEEDKFLAFILSEGIIRFWSFKAKLPKSTQTPLQAAVYKLRQLGRNLNDYIPYGQQVARTMELKRDRLYCAIM